MAGPLSFTFRIATFIACALVFTSGVCEAITSEDVNTAIRKAILFEQDAQLKNGMWHYQSGQDTGATALIARPQYPTMPVAIYRLLGQPGATNYGQALAMSTLLMAVCALGFVGIERLRGDEF